MGGDIIAYHLVLKALRFKRSGTETEVMLPHYQAPSSPLPTARTFQFSSTSRDWQLLPCLDHILQCAPSA